MKLTSDRRNFFLGFLALVSLAFLAILVPFYSALMWAVILAMLFAPMQRALMRRMPQRPNTATFITLGAVIMMVIIPVIGLTMSLVNQGAEIYGRIRSGELNFGAYLAKIIEAMPGWLHRMLDAQGLLDLPSIQRRLADSGSEIGQFLASQAVNIGQGGSIPFIATLKETFPDAQVLVTGIEDPDTRAHSENESMHLGELEHIVAAEALLLARLGGAIDS